MTKPRIRESEIRAFLLRYAAKRNILVKEYTSDQPGDKIAFYCHLEDAYQDKTATAISYEHFDNALCMAFLNFSNPELDFIE
mgnify:CR=1 FL=1